MYSDIIFNIPKKYKAYIALEYCNNGDLNNYVKFNKQYNVIDAISQIFNGLWHLYKNHIIHLDLAPANIFVHKLDKDIFKIGDFGISKLDNKINNKDLELGTKYYKPSTKITKKNIILC